jgi:glycosyltransferase involved in cell wall biosynthesis
VQPRISIITASFNAGATIGDTLASVARQTGVDYEHIVVDGASRDDTMDVVQRHAHPRLSAVSEPDKGIYDAMNKGIARATGDYLLFLNADDYLARPDSLKLAADAIAQSGTDCLFADTRFVADEGRQPRRHLYSARRFSPWWLRIGAMPPHPSMFLRRSLMEELGGYDASYRIAGDFDFISRAILQRRATYATLPVVLTHFRVGGVSTSGLGSKLTLSREMARSLHHLGQPLSQVAVMLRFPLKLAQFAIFRQRSA